MVRSTYHEVKIKLRFESFIFWKQYVKILKDKLFGDAKSIFTKAPVHEKMLVNLFERVGKINDMMDKTMKNFCHTKYINPTVWSTHYKPIVGILKEFRELKTIVKSKNETIIYFNCLITNVAKKMIIRLQTWFRECLTSDNFKKHLRLCKIFEKFSIRLLAKKHMPLQALACHLLSLTEKNAKKDHFIEMKNVMSDAYIRHIETQKQISTWLFVVLATLTLMAGGYLVLTWSSLTSGLPTWSSFLTQFRARTIYTMTAALPNSIEFPDLQPYVWPSCMAAVLILVFLCAIMRLHYARKRHKQADGVLVARKWHKEKLD
jgi:hypothetical protein